MWSSTRKILARAAVLAAAAFVLLAATGCPSMRDPDGQAIPWGPNNEWERSAVPPGLFND